jgi:hypothetical protein
MTTAEPCCQEHPGTIPTDCPGTADVFVEGVFFVVVCETCHLYDYSFTRAGAEQVCDEHNQDELPVAEYEAVRS